MKATGTHHTPHEIGAIDVMTEVDAIVSERWPFLSNRLHTDHAKASTVPLTELQTPTQIGSYLQRFARQYVGQDSRGIASLWAQWYLVTVWPPLVAATLVLGTEPVLAPDRTALALDEEAKPNGLSLPAHAMIGDPVQGLQRLARLHATPLLEGAAKAASMSPRVTWSNAANVLSWFLEELQTIATPEALAPGYALLKHPCWPDSTPNPLYLANDHRNDGRPTRRVCCLRYRLDDFGYCPDCPITRRSGGATR